MMVKKSHAAFTLVELLVVISIIALLMAVLLPALTTARQQARVVVCGLNLKQIGAAIAAYQSSNDGKVPVMLNRFTPLGAGYPAKSRLLSVALYRYYGTTNLSHVDDGIFDPDGDWGNSQDTRIKPDYFKKYLPKFYVCPFVRGRKANATKDFTQGSGVSFNNGVTYNTMVSEGSGESYVVWCWETVRDYPYTPNHPLGLPNGTPKYGALSWNAYPTLQTLDYSQLEHSAVIWNKTNLMRVKSNSMSEASILYCEQGETDNYSAGSNLDNGIYNYGSHKRSGRGGTNALMADTHVEWVEGTRIGWP
jgi:prepilin-type N-terminal cleavage/methylation domain-containing protein/prepilin-type processing-associated H-X9-DG protein